MNLITLTLSDEYSALMISRTLSTEPIEKFEEKVKEFENESPYKKHHLITGDYLHLYHDEVKTILDSKECIY
jgi:hypothetical protein